MSGQHIKTWQERMAPGAPAHDCIPALLEEVMDLRGDRQAQRIELAAARALLAEVVQLDYGVVDSSYGHCTPSAEFYEVLSRIRTFLKGADA